jgi:hypothetical protein
MRRYFVSLALVASLLGLSACCGNSSGACNGSHHMFYTPMPFNT